MGMRGCREGVERCRGMPQVVESPRKDGVRPHALKNSRTQRSWNQRPWWMRWIASAKKVGVQKLSSPCPVPAQRHRAMAAEAQSLGPSSREGWLCDDPVLPTLEDVPDFLPPRSFMMSADFAASLTPAGKGGGGCLLTRVKKMIGLRELSNSETKLIYSAAKERSPSLAPGLLV